METGKEGDNQNPTRSPKRVKQSNDMNERIEKVNLEIEKVQQEIEKVNQKIDDIDKDIKIIENHYDEAKNRGDREECQRLDKEKKYLRERIERLDEKEKYLRERIERLEEKEKRLDEKDATESRAFDEEALQRSLNDFFRQKRPTCPQTTEKYKLSDVFHGEPIYWLSKLRLVRFEGSVSRGILYRPEIVNDIKNGIDQALSSVLERGLMIKGPQWIGKSHSIVNTVLKLQSTGKYLVTFIPDCDKWKTAQQLIDIICESFCSKSQTLGFQMKEVNYDSLSAAIREIDSVLKRMGKKWVFFFDQINKLFVKPANINAKDASGLAFPFDMIYSVIMPGRITSVISASANNEMAYKDRHEGFDEYNHPTEMTEIELLAAFDGFSKTDAEQVKDLAGFVPGFVDQYLYEYKRDTSRFIKDVASSVRDSLRGLQRSPYWYDIRQSTISCLLDIPTNSSRYDKKYFLANQQSSDQHSPYTVLIPLVKDGARELLWKDIMEFVRNEESNLLNVCSLPSTTNDVRGRLFEYMVIRRCQDDGVGLVDKITYIPEGLHTFAGQELPNSTKVTADGIYVPNNPNFPAIDVIWKVEKTIYGVQIHIANHDNVVQLFEAKCRNAGWFSDFNQIYLVYLSPNERTKALIAKFVQANHEVNLPENKKFSIQQFAVCLKEIPCLSGLQWNSYWTS